MTRRPVKMGVSRARTGWLLWLAWGIFGAIFLFEDAGGGSLVLSFVVPVGCVAPFVALARCGKKSRHGDAG